MPAVSPSFTPAEESPCPHGVPGDSGTLNHFTPPPPDPSTHRAMDEQNLVPSGTPQISSGVGMSWGGLTLLITAWPRHPSISPNLGGGTKLSPPQEERAAEGWGIPPPPGLHPAILWLQHVILHLWAHSPRPPPWGQAVAF